MSEMSSQPSSSLGFYSLERSLNCRIPGAKQTNEQKITLKIKNII